MWGRDETIVAQRMERTAKEPGREPRAARVVKEEKVHLSVCQGSGGAKECGANVDREGESVLEMKADHL